MEYLNLEELRRAEREELIQRVREHDAEMDAIDGYMQHRAKRARALRAKGKSWEEAEDAVDDKLGNEIRIDPSKLTLAMTAAGCRGGCDSRSVGGPAANRVETRVASFFL